MKNMSNVYPFFEIGGYMTYKDKFFGEMSFRYVVNGNIDTYWASNASLNLGIGVFLSKKNV
ncbi:MAG: hypothetical protein SPJ83_06260 [Helicobacter sp.]|uniref:hypothetical protein n=1 Tax=Helicobacter sp. TaxID=218 RepID=UPI002A91FB42|nr:hypothetical protein [Helicobacter sp.]MDY5822378.1 hypothetical protein [Helicobacter sp.]